MPMAKSTVKCPHCSTPVTATVGELARCPSCGGELRIHAVGENEQDEALRRLLSTVKIVERVDKDADAPPPRRKKRPPPKRPWWKFWG
jgi:primosomal protein N'